MAEDNLPKNSEGIQSPEEGAQTGPKYKELLDEAAIEARRAEQKTVNPIIEKVAQYIPAAGKLLSADSQQNQSKETPPGPPERPHHDCQIEEFVRDQHLSRKEDGALE